MKKYIIIAAAALAASVSCSKVETFDDVQREINFEVARFVRTKANTALDTLRTFGTYSWFTAESNNGSQGVDFMVNETVGYVNPVWKTINNTFYWPKTGSIDFISYSPFDGSNGSADSNPVVKKDSLIYTNIVAKDIDYLYADKVTVACPNGATTNDVSYNGTPDFKGVPTLFRHALAKVSFQIKANFLEQGNSPTDTTKWKLTVEEFKIGGLYTKGDLHLAWNGTKWEPKNSNKTWENPSAPTAQQELADSLVLTTEYQALGALEDPFVLPQELQAYAQTLKIKVKIETTLANGNQLLEYFDKTLNLKDISSLQAIKMNQNLEYKINIKPTANVSTPDSPEDVTITFDPAVADWEGVSAEATIQI
ncbi:MAG: fimbrillin family protein [Bacteroidales bacterium]|nr:fimbrillin family protein [Bacteroidales bacterium]